MAGCGAEMSRSALLLCLLAAVCGAEHPSQLTRGRIVGGKSALIWHFPWRISLEEYHDGRIRHICGGAVISSTWVLTAAQCIQDSTPEGLTVRAGTSTREIGGYVYSVARIIEHEDFDYDIALLQMLEPISLGRNIQAVKLGSSEIANGTEVKITSWSPDTAGGGEAVQMQAVTMSIVDRGNCRAAYRNLYVDVTESMICANREGTCVDELGAPLVVGNTLYGLFSWGFRCDVGAGYPGVYVNVAAARSWITEETGI